MGTPAATPPSASPPPAAPGQPRPLRRDLGGGILGGVCSGLAAHTRVDPLLVRVAFVAAAAAGGLGLAIYALAWVLVPAAPARDAPPRRARTGRGAVETALGTGLLLLSVLLAFREAGLWFSDALVWPLVLVASGAALLWRQSQAAVARAQAADPGPPAPAGPPAADLSARAAVVSRTGLGAALVIAAGVAFLQATGSLSAARDVALAALVVAIVLAVIFAPWIVRLGRSLAAERAERIRSQERAEVAAHLHDSVLHTLALVQRRADSPQAVATLARRQERELRSWLSARPGEKPSRGLAGALGDAVQNVERTYGVAVELVTVGDCELNAPTGALVASAREAMVNAAKFAAGAPIDVYVEAGEHRIDVFVRDRGPGFDPARVPTDRRGVRDSIVGRMERHGGQAALRAAPAGGTEVQLSLERDRK